MQGANKSSKVNGRMKNTATDKAIWKKMIVEKEYSHHTTRLQETCHFHNSLVGSYVNGKVQFITLWHRKGETE